VFLVLIWVLVFVGSQRLFFGKIILPQRPQHNPLVWRFFNYFENNCPEDVRNQAQSYLLRIVALTNATDVCDGYLLNVGTTTFHVRDRMSGEFEERKTPNPVTRRRAFSYRTTGCRARSNCHRVTDAQE
jgi:hypothetical protein